MRSTTTGSYKGGNFRSLHHLYLWLTHARIQQVKEAFKQGLSGYQGSQYAMARIGSSRFERRIQVYVYRLLIY